MKQSVKKSKARAKSAQVIKRLKPLRDSGAGELRVNMMNYKTGRRLDIRYFVKTDKYTGYTKKGISLSAEEFDALMSRRKKIMKLFNP